MQFADICGWVGMVSLLIAYCLISSGKIAGRSYANQWINFFGAITVGFNAYAKALWAVVALDAFWCGVAIFTIVQMFFKKSSQ